MIGRIAVGAALGGVIGYERDLHRRPVGLRTHLIVSLTAATFMVISSQFVYQQHYGADDHLVEVDTSRIAASVVSGVAFVAGGAILRTGLSIQGLTTAAGLWLVTAIGMSAGAGMFVVSCAVTAIGLLALTVLRRFEDKRDDVVRRRITITLRRGLTPIESVQAALQTMCLDVADIEYETKLATENSLVVTFEVQVAAEVRVSTLLARLEALAGVEQVRVHLL